MRKMIVCSLLVAAAAFGSTGCQTLRGEVRDEKNAGCLGAANDNTPRTVAMVAGGIVAASGPAVLIGGIILDKTPATPPVEAYVAGAGLTTVGVATILVASAVL